MKTKFRIIAGDETSYDLAPRTGGNVKALKKLQLSSAYYDDTDRYGLAKETCSSEWIEKEEDKGEGKVAFVMKEPTLGVDAFRDDVAALLFPSAPVSANVDNIDYEQVEEALEVFMGFTEPKHRKLSALSSLLTAYQSGIVPGTEQAMQENPISTSET